MAPKNTNIPDLFWPRVDVRGPDECWPWKLGLDRAAGYGRMRVDGKLRRAPRIAWWLTHGAWPTACRHVCDHPPCCNPAHLLDGTNIDNVRDREERGRTSRGSKYPGHKLTEELVREARELRRAGMTYRALGEKYGVSFPTIYGACTRKRWRHVA